MRTTEELCRTMGLQEINKNCPDLEERRARGTTSLRHNFQLQMLNLDSCIPFNAAVKSAL
jgi:hypothetical protein